MFARVFKYIKRRSSPEGRDFYAFGIFFLRKPNFWQPVSPCAAANAARRWGQGARMLGCRMWGRLVKAQHWAGRCPGRLVVGCWARLWARHLARPCASWLWAKRLETARVRSCLVGSTIARGRWRSGLRGAGSHFRLLLLVSGARSWPERTCNRTFACKDASAYFVPLVSWSSWGVLREASLTGSSAGASFQAVVGWEAYPKLSDAT